LLAEKENVTDFDTMFDIIKDISWKKYFKKNYPIIVKTSSIRSDLFATRTIQIL
jgi:23S rRNA G2445 N2-methylase RlmL